MKRFEIPITWVILASLATSLAGDARTGIQFVEVQEAAELKFRYRNSPTPYKYLIETMGGGVAILDYDNDGWQDVFFVNGAKLQNPQPDNQSPDKSAPEFWNRLFRNRGDGKFTDVTEKAGLKGHGYGMGVATGDIDNDGDTDLFVTNYGDCVLYRNNGDGTFADVTAQAGIHTEGWNMSAGFFDHDNDGYLDIFVTRYLVWNFSIGALVCGPAIPGGRAYCHPNEFKAISNYLFRNNRDGTFTDVSAPAGIKAHDGYGLGVSFADFNQDGFVDVYVANDAFPQFLFKNNRDGTFTEVAALAGAGFTEDGNTFSGMGTVFADLDNDGFSDILTTALPYEYFTHFHNNGDGTFNYASVTSNLAQISRPFGGWGIHVFDADNDGVNEVFVATSHVMENIEVTQPHLSYMQRPLLLRFMGSKFVDISEEAGEPFKQAWAARGAAFGDLNNDGYLDIVVVDYNASAHVLRNTGGNHHWISVELIGNKSNRDGIGAEIQLTTGNGKSQFRMVTTAGSYASANDRRAFFGLGQETVIKQIRTRWPSGIEQVIDNPRPDQFLKVVEETETSTRNPTAIIGVKPRSAAEPFALSARRRGFLRLAAFLDNKDAMAMYRQGVLLAQQGKPAEAAVALRTAIEMKPDYVEAHYALGVLLHELGRTNAAEAVDQFLAVLKLQPGHVGAHVELSSILAEAGDSEAASIQLQKALAVAPKNAELYVRLGQQQILSLKYDEAIQSFEKALEFDPFLSAANYGKGLALAKQHKKKEAEKQFEIVLRLNPQDADSHYQLGKIALESSRMSDAVTHLAEAVRIRPGYAEAHEDLGKAYRKLDKLQEAEQSLRTALRFKPDLFGAVYALAQLLQSQNKTEEAKTLYAQVEEMQEKRSALGRANVANTDGLRLMEMGRINEALALFRHAQAIDPSFFMAAYNEGVALARQGKKSEGVASLRRAVRIRPDFVMAHYALGIVLKTLGDPEGDREIAKAHALKKFVAQPLGRNAASFVSPQLGNK